MNNTKSKIQPSHLDGLTFETTVHSLASNLLTVKLASGDELKFYGRSDDTMFAETFALTDEAGKRFSFSPGNVEAVIEQLRAAVAAGYCNLQNFG